MNWQTALRLGRVSNLPTVWSNSLAGLVLAGSGLALDVGFGLMAIMSLFYVGGMYINDAFDQHIDAAERPERPIPSGQVSAGTVYVSGFIMLALGIAALFLWAGWRPGLTGVALAGAIIYYDWRHKTDPIGPAWMGLCRVLVYLAAAFLVTTQPPAVLYMGAGALFCYLIGLTYIAKQENLGAVANLWPLLFLAVPAVAAIWIAATNGGLALILAVIFVVWMVNALRYLWRRQPGDIPRAVVSLIAGMSLLDAVFIAHMGAGQMAIAAALCFVATLAFQRFIPGT
ncbi:MAG: UbiA family prenyltransferase [Alphaproteobacteria bacterium]|jgi:4-hydroxybenzoate polyprenyltransferase|nr:UbiA family prenyltransferase [Alphaproteobacteria bacterium]MDP6830910.1 UbiA family prenyltransferase [Alphaproteobacteria bacterium]